MTTQPQPVPSVALEVAFESAITGTFNYLDHRRRHPTCNPDVCEDGGFLRIEALRTRHQYRSACKEVFG